MPRGLSGVANAAEKVSRNGGGGGGQLYFKLGPGESTVVRFLEQGDDVAWAWCHEVPVEGRSWGDAVPCLDQDDNGEPCPGCERDMARKFKGWINLIWEDAPVFKRDAENKLVRENGKPVIIGHKPQAAVWSSGIRLFEELAELDTTWKGLRSRPFRVKRKGEGLDTKYVINPADPDGGKTPFSADEQQIEDTKSDVAKLSAPPTYEEFEKRLNGGTASSAPSRQEATSTATRVNPFMRRSS